ncbi:sulfotransferase family 2 domain-containing protein [Thiohalophilus thiocyanatoxydans]|uniref:Sulfotransferase family protein n=1 Tax=Thiohalophilus thiocyanatoxydans TaxID=381308 RepID=A0A4R8ITE5_9GAMM|nr:sulfotransferase family 2 domain-containing protein [Thiohalophilus thiocyanatoxydans]TDY02680.1 sulfotransferase family protein [Thiohalophilus thiocyanatoxydans]
MIISHKYKYIFLHTPKVAGSSIAVYLSQFLGDDDLMLDAWNDALNNRIPYNKRVFREINNEYGLQMISEALKRRENDGKLFERPVLDYALRKNIAKKLGTESVHAAAIQVAQYAPEEWSNYFKFAFLRNPYTHAVSFFRFNESAWSLAAGKENELFENNSNSNGQFKNFLRGVLYERNKGIQQNSLPERNYEIPGDKIYMIDGDIAVDYIGRFETLEADIEKISNIIKLPPSVIPFPHTKKNSPVNIRDIYDDESKALVEEIWSNVFRHFDYEFPL